MFLLNLSEPVSFSLQARSSLLCVPVTALHTGPITGGAEKFSWPVRRASSVNEPLFGRCRFEDRDGVSMEPAHLSCDGFISSADPAQRDGACPQRRRAGVFATANDVGASTLPSTNRAKVC